MPLLEAMSTVYRYPTFWLCNGSAIAPSSSRPKHDRSVGYCLTRSIAGTMLKLRRPCFQVSRSILYTYSVFANSPPVPHPRSSMSRVTYSTSLSLVLVACAYAAEALLQTYAATGIYACSRGAGHLSSCLLRSWRMALVFASRTFACGRPR